MGKSQKSKYYVTDYFLSLHYGICHGPIDALLGVWIKERDAWPGTVVYPDTDGNEDNDDDPPPTLDFLKGLIESLNQIWSGTVAGGRRLVKTTAGRFTINKPSLFGGDKKEGGVAGSVEYLPGFPDQTIPEDLAARFGRTSATMPAYRGIASLFFFDGFGGASGRSKGFLWAQNNPYLPGVWVTVLRTTKTVLNPAFALIQVGDAAGECNPAHIIMESISNSAWGMGAPLSIINIASFEVASERLWNEKFGMCLIWTASSPIESFVKEVLDHIQATLFVDPETGLLTIKLIRADYNIDDLRHYDENNSDITNRQRKAWAETTNEIVITWTNPTNEQEETLTFQDNANLAMQGGTISDGRNYYGIRRADLAAVVGARDIRSASYPTFSCTLETDRRGWKEKPGGVVTIGYAEEGIESLVMRVGKIDYGRPGDMTIKAELVEDIFALESGVWAEPSGSLWVPTDKPATLLDHTKIMAIPQPLLISNGTAATDENYPAVVVGWLANDEDSEVANIVVSGEDVLATGDLVFKKIADIQPVARAKLTAGLVRQAQTITSQIGAFVGGVEPDVGDFGILGDTNDDTINEWVLFVAYNSGTEEWTLARGVWDTVPREWPTGTGLWVVKPEFEQADVGEHVAGETVEYKFQMQTFLGLYPIANTPTETAVMTARPHLPFRPANVTVAGSAFADVAYSDPDNKPVNIAVTWANRNRGSEDVVAQRWTNPNVAPETGQTTRIVCLRPDGSTIITYDNLPGTSYDIPYLDIAESPEVTVLVYAKRDGLLSLQAHAIKLIFEYPGYGFGYGLNYGEGT